MEQVDQLTKMQLMNGLLFEMLDGREVIVRLHDSIYGEIHTGPFHFQMTRFTLDRVVIRNEFHTVLQFSVLGLQYIMRNEAHNQCKHIERKVPIRTFIPIERADGVVELTLLKVPMFDIDRIRELYRRREFLDPDKLALLGMQDHPIFTITSESEVLAMLHELNIEDSYELTQLAYLSQLKGMLIGEDVERMIS